MDPAERWGSTDHLDGLLARFALAQGGAVGRGQLLAHGIGKGAIDRRLASGHLHTLMLAGRRLAGVYAVGRAVLDPGVGWQWAAWLACGAKSVMTHRTAADVIDLLASRRLEVTIPPRARRRPAGITVHRHALDPRDITTVNGLPTTSWARTVLDLAAVETPKRLALALDRTVTLRLFDRRGVDDVLERHPRAHGSPALRVALAVMTDDGQRTASPAEVDVHWLVKTSDLPQPLVNAPLLGYVADLLWPAQRFIVEVDSTRWHDGPFARRDDHRRQAALEAAGYAVLRVRPSDPADQTLQRIGHGLGARSVDRPR
ncbi:MAG TPA: DUF559 domain-containing protein [Solirubrobacteraceae bacterium]|nr:DUF559 domain-containing protein [Solirubrobacteraceae bacterium]